MSDRAAIYLIMTLVAILVLSGILSGAPSP